MPHGDSYLALTARVPRPRRGVTGEPAFLDNVLHYEVLGKNCVHLSNMPRRRLVHRRSNEQYLEHHRKAAKPERGTAALLWTQLQLPSSRRTSPLVLFLLVGQLAEITTATVIEMVVDIDAGGSPRFYLGP
jgi:hypothetical protein